jgi:hypothetical protein
VVHAGVIGQECEDSLHLQAVALVFWGQHTQFKTEISKISLKIFDNR